MVMGAGAAFTDQDKIVNEEAVDMISALGIVDGYEDDSFQPSKNIERGEAAKMIAVMLNGGKDAIQDATGSSFNDVLGSADAWANKYIEYCVSEKIVAGVGGDRFAPASNVTGTQLAKMLLVSLGYDADKEGYLDDTYWAVNVNADAASAGLYAGVESIDMNAALTRDNAAQMIWNALQAETVRYSLAGQAVKTGDTLLETAFGDDYAIDTGVMAQVYYNQDTKEYTYSIVNVNVDRNSWWNVIGGGTFMDGADTYVTTKDFSDLFAMNVTVLHNGNNALLIRVNEGGTVVEGTLGDISEFDGTSIDASTSIKVNGQSYRLDNVVGDAANVTIAFNGFDDYSRPGASNTYTNPVLKDQYSFRAIDLDGGNDIDLFVVYPYEVLKTDLVKNNTFRVDELERTDAYLTATVANAQDSTLFNLLHKDASDIVTREQVVVNGTVATDGYVMVVPATFTATGMDTYTVLDAQSASVTKAADLDNMITLGDTEYDGYMLVDRNGKHDTFKQISVGKEYSYIQVNGYLFIMDGTGIVPAATNYAVVTARADNATTSYNTYETDLLLTTGETITVNAKVMDDNDNWWPSYSAQPNVGVMYTYSVNANGNYELTRVADGTAATTSVFDNQQVYKTGARLADEDVANNDGEPDRFKVDNGSAWFANENKTTKYFEVADDAVIFAFIDRTPADGDQRADEYVVLTGADLALLDGTNAGNGGVNWAFTGANTTSQGVPVVEMGYVYLNADPRDTSEYAYINGVSYRDGGYGVTVDVVTADGKEVLNSAKYYSQTDPVLVDLYNNLNVTGKTAAQRVVEVIYDKDGYLVGYKDVAVTSDTVEKYNGSVLEVKGYDQFLTKTDDTVFIDVSGENNLTVGDKVLYKLATGSDDLDLVVYNY